MPKLTKRVIDALRPAASGEVMAWDSELRGFGVRVMPSGVATYVLKYRNAEGRQRKLALGRTGALTPDEARALARQHLGEVARGVDPSAARSQLRKSLTVAELCDAYLADAEHRVKASTLKMDRSRIGRHVKPLMGTRTVASLTPQDVARMQADIIAGRTATERKGRGGRTTGGKGVANRTVGMLGTILEFAVSRGIIAENPARKVERAADGRQRRFLSMPEVQRLGAALRGLGEEQTGAAAIRFLLLSGCRRMEALGMRREWLDAQSRCVRFPDTKSGAQVRALGTLAVKAVQGSPALNGWAFASERGKGHFVGLPKVLARACKQASLEGVTLHVLRHTFAASAAEMGLLRADDRRPARAHRPRRDSALCPRRRQCAGLCGRAHLRPDRRRAGWEAFCWCCRSARLASCAKLKTRYPGSPPKPPILRLPVTPSSSPTRPLRSLAKQGRFA